jgi:thiamine biosynthesis protein ThiS
LRISVKTNSVLAQYLPPGSARDRAQLEVAEGTTPFDVMRKLGFPETRTYLVIVNDDLVPKAERTRRALAENDELAILPPLKGG